MRLLSYLDAAGRPGLGALRPTDPDTFVDLNATDAALPPTLADLLSAEGGMAQAAAVAARAGAVVRPLAGLRYAPPVARPGKIVCLGLNYADHAREGGNARPEYPSFFLRGPESIVAHAAPILRPRVSDKLDYEAELAFVIGRRIRHATRDNALAAIAGYSAFNDGSVRDYQRKSSQWTIGKNFDATGGFGPWLVTPDELPPAADGLRICSRLNGRTMQDANTRDFLWGIVETMVLITECMTLEPGDVVITGTPAGVGYARTPPVFMQPGDICEVEIEGIGTLRNPIAAEPA